eukprot:gene11530-40384_t
MPWVTCGCCAGAAAIRRARRRRRPDCALPFVGATPEEVQRPVRALLLELEALCDGAGSVVDEQVANLRVPAGAAGLTQLR